MRRRIPLRAKSPLRQKSTRKPKKTKPTTIPSLIKKADGLFSRYVRLRDSQLDESTGKRVGICITCPRHLVVVDEDGRWKKNAQNGHFIGRGSHFLRYNDKNNNLQCAFCNAWADKESMLEAYREALDNKYGTGTYSELKRLAHENNSYRLKREELGRIIHKTQIKIDHYLLTNN